MILIIDVFNHFYPKEYLDALSKPLPEQVVWISSTMRGINDLEYRLTQMDRFGVDMQVLSLPMPTLDDLSNIPVHEFERITKTASDGIARIAEQSQGRFKGIATVSLLDVGKAIDEVERVVKDLGLLGVQILSNVRGKPLDLQEFELFYSKISQLGCGLWIHPTFMRKIYDWMNDEYNMNMMMGWGIDTSLAMFRIFRGGGTRKAFRSKNHTAPHGYPDSAHGRANQRFRNGTGKERPSSFSAQEDPDGVHENVLRRYCRRDVEASHGSFSRFLWFFPHAFWHRLSLG